MLHITPRQIGEIRAKNPQGVAFLERSIINEYEEKMKAHKEAKKKSRSLGSKGHRRR